MSQSRLVLSAKPAGFFFKVTTGCFLVFFFVFVVALWNVTTKSAQRSLHEKKKDAVTTHLHGSSRSAYQQCRRSVDKILNCQQQATWTRNGPQLYSSECANMHGRTHAHAQRKKEKSCATPPLPPLFPSAHIHSDSSLCSHIAIRGTQLTSTSLTGCLLSFIDCNPANPEVMTEECYCSKVSMKKALWRAGLGGVEGISGRLQKREWRKGKEATNSFASMDFVYLPELYLALGDAGI